MTICKTECPIMKYYYFLGKKWSYPFLFNLKQNKSYSFEDFINISNRKISRALLTDLLKESMQLQLIEKKENKYQLTSLACELKNLFNLTRETLLKFHSKKKASLACSETCLINRERECNIRDFRKV